LRSIKAGFTGFFDGMAATSSENTRNLIEDGLGF